MTYGIALALMLAIGILLYFLQSVTMDETVKKIIRTVGIIIVVIIAIFIVFSLFNQFTGGALNKPIG